MNAKASETIGSRFSCIRVLTTSYPIRAVRLMHSGEIEVQRFRQKPELRSVLNDFCFEPADTPPSLYVGLSQVMRMAH